MFVQPVMRPDQQVESGTVWNRRKDEWWLSKPTVSEAAADVQLGAGKSRLFQRGLAFLAGPGPGPAQVSVLALVLFRRRAEHASEYVLVQPRLAALRHVAQQAGQRAARSPSAPEDPERQEVKKKKKKKWSWSQWRFCLNRS